MKYIPHWVIDALMSKKFKCHHCQKVFTHKNVRGLGIRESINEPERETFFIELNCMGCRKITFFEMQEMNIVEFAEEVISEIDEDLEELDSSGEEFNEEDMFKDKKIRKKKSSNEYSKKQPQEKEEKQEVSKITLKDVIKANKVLEPEDLKHENMLEMMGMTPEEIFQNREIE